MVLGYLVDKELVISGKLIVKKDFGHGSPFILDLLPWQRVAEIKKDDQGNYSQKILDQPVYFDLNLPQRFDKGTAEITYKNDSIDCPTLFQIGGQATPNDWEYAMKPLENQNLDQLDWPRVEENDVVLYEREKKFNTIDEFLNNLPDISKIAVYNYKLDYDFKIPDYKPTKGLEIDNTIRGRHTIYTYIDGGEPLDFTFTVEDINRHVGADPAEIAVYKKDQRIYNTTLPDDGITDESGESSEERKIRLLPSNLTQGTYKIEIKASDDIFIRNIKTKEHLLAFAGRLYLADNDEYKDSLSDIRTKPTTVYAKGYKIITSAAHQTSEQTIRINNLTEPNDYEIELAEAHQQYSYYNLNPRNIVSLYSPKNDILIEGDGLFSFSKESFFNPLLTTFRDESELEVLGINYVIADYQTPKTIDGWKVATADFDLGRLYWRENTLRFALSIPDIECQDKKIKGIKFVLEKEPLTWGKLWEKIKEKL
jgi:hypothetical protein